MNLKNLKKYILKEIKLLKEQPGGSCYWFPNSGVNLANDIMSNYQNNGFLANSTNWVTNPDEYLAGMGSIPTEDWMEGDSAPFIYTVEGLNPQPTIGPSGQADLSFEEAQINYSPCSNGGRHVYSITCDPNVPDYLFDPDGWQSAIELNTIDNCGFLVNGPSYNIVQSTCSKINGQTPNASHIGKMVNIVANWKSMVIAINPFRDLFSYSNVGGGSNLTLLPDDQQGEGAIGPCETSINITSFDCVTPSLAGVATGDPYCQALNEPGLVQYGAFDTLEDCLNSGCLPIEWEGSCSTYNDFIEQSNGLTSFEVPEEISLEEGKEAFCDKCYDYEGLFIGNPWGFCTCCPPMEPDDSVSNIEPIQPIDKEPTKEPLKKPLDQEDSQVIRMQNLAGINPEKK